LTPARLYIDEDSMRRALVFGLRARYVDVLTASDAGMVNHPDEEHLTLAAEQGRSSMHSTRPISASFTSFGSRMDAITQKS
jgi:hypothetical protein